ncbi:hypothetical protein GW915_12075 [bacterium]|nr:hypothetical protein [bacterium]
MKEFLISLLLLVVVSVVFSFNQGLLSLDKRASENGIPEFSLKQKGVDEELQKLLAEADAAGSDAEKKEEIAAAEPSVEIGDELYNQTGANSCLYCHGVGGVGGNVAAAAKLKDPSTWKIAKILGAAAVDSDKFTDATVHIIAKGAIVHNSTYKDMAPWFDMSKAGSAYDAQMVGLTGAPSATYLRQNKAKGITPEVAAKSLYMYIRTF